MITQALLPAPSPFFLKPKGYDPGRTDERSCTPDPGRTLYEQYVPELRATLSLRSLDLALDLDMIYGWVNKAYAQRFWQLHGTPAVIEHIYRNVLENTQVHSFIGAVDGKAVCQIDAYAVAADELASHVELEPGDSGLHLLVCPPREMQRGLSYYALRCFQQYYFSFDEAGRLFAEPDQENTLANKLAIDTGFRFVKTIQLSYKTANLYSITREQFLRR